MGSRSAATLQHSDVVDHLEYDPLTGLVRCRKKFCSKVRVGDILGNPKSGGYLRFTFKKVQLLNHRLIWFMHYGHWPHLFIDHIDRDVTNNRLCNLRLATVVQNAQNAGIFVTNTTGIRGVSLSGRKNKPYVMSISVNGKQTHKRYKTIEDAEAARLEAELFHFGSFAPSLNDRD